MTKPLEQPHVDPKKTRELCDHEREGRRCMRPKGHADQHAAFTPADTIEWES